MKNKASKIVSSALIGQDYRTVIINSKRYIIFPPTIRKLAGAAYYLSDVDGDNPMAIITSQTSLSAAAAALSQFIKGDDSLVEELSAGTLDEILQGLVTAYELVSPQNFSLLSSLARNVSEMTAKPKR